VCGRFRPGPTSRAGARPGRRPGNSRAPPAGRGDDSRVTLCRHTVARGACRRSSSWEPVVRGAHVWACASPTRGNLIARGRPSLGGGRPEPYSERHRSPTVVVVPGRIPTAAVPGTRAGRSAVASPRVGPLQLKSFEPWPVMSLPLLPTAARTTAGPSSRASAFRRSPVHRAARTSGASTGTLAWIPTSAQCRPTPTAVGRVGSPRRDGCVRPDGPRPAAIPDAAPLNVTALNTTPLSVATALNVTPVGTTPPALRRTR